MPSKLYKIAPAQSGIHIDHKLYSWYLQQYFFRIVSLYTSFHKWSYPPFLNVHILRFINVHILHNKREPYYQLSIYFLEIAVIPNEDNLGLKYNTSGRTMKIVWLLWEFQKMFNTKIMETAEICKINFLLDIQRCS